MRLAIHLDDAIGFFTDARFDALTQPGVIEIEDLVAAMEERLLGPVVADEEWNVGRHRGRLRVERVAGDGFAVNRR